MPQGSGAVGIGGGLNRPAMDMWEPCRDAVRAAMPQAIIVIDKFHVVRMANSCLEAIRKNLREGLANKQRRGLMHDRFVLLRREDDLEGLQRINLESWTRNYPVLGAAYRAKEDFFDIYNAETAKKAQAMFTEWESTLAPEIKDAFYPLVRAFNNWMPEIMAYFNNRVTNAYTESLNNLIRLTNRLGRGYSFEALTAKILFTEGVCKIKKPGFHRPGEEEMGMVAYALEKGVSTEFVEREINYGADISTLIRLLEEGKL
jgi:transposase